MPKKVAEIKSRNVDEEESECLEGEGMKIIIPSNTIDFYTTLEISLGLKLSGHTDTLTEAINPIDDLFRRGEIQKELKYRNAPNKFKTI